MSDLVQKKYDEWLRQSGGGTLEAAFAAGFAIRQSLAQGGEAVAWGVQKTGEYGVWFVSDSRFTAQHYATVYAHRVGDGKPDQAVIPLYAHPATDADRVAELEAQCNHLASALAERTEQLTESQEREGRMWEALAELVRLVKSAGVNRLMTGVQLGRVSWVVKMNDALDAADAALAAEKGNEGE